MIIDAHAHIGRSLFSGVDTTEAELLESMMLNGVDMALVMPQPSEEPVEQYHDRIAKFAADNPAKIKGMASIPPRWSTERYERELRRCVQELGFVGVKLHPLGHNISPEAAECGKIFAMAGEMGLPVIVHTGTGLPHALPSLLLTPAREYPNTKIIIDHAGFAVFADEALAVARVYSNYYLNPSWCCGFQVKKMVDKLGSKRVMMGSDHTTNLPVELTKFRSIGLTQGQLDDCLYKTTLISERRRDDREGRRAVRNRELSAPALRFDAVEQK